MGQGLPDFTVVSVPLRQHVGIGALSARPGHFGLGILYEIIYRNLAKRIWWSFLYECLSSKNIEAQLILGFIWSYKKLILENMFEKSHVDLVFFTLIQNHATKKIASQATTRKQIHYCCM